MSSPRRITLLHSHFTAMGGAEILLAAHARWLRQAGYEVTMCAFHVAPTYPLPHLETGADRAPPVHVIGLPAGLAHVESLMPHQVASLVTRTQLVLRDADVVIAYNYPAAPIAALAAPRTARTLWYACEPFRPLYTREGNPVTSARAERLGRSAPDGATQQLARRLSRRRWRHLLLPWTGARERALRTFDGAGVRALHGVASLSRYGAACVTAATGRADVRVLYPMVDFPPAAPVSARRTGMSRESPQLLAQTRVAVPKNLDTLVRAFGLVRAQHPRAVLHVVGGGGRAALERLAADVAPDGVRFHGFLAAPALAELAATCDVFAFTPADEPFGLVFPEAAARGLLLVGPDHGGPREIIADDDIGATCDAFDATSIAAAIMRTVALSDAEADAQRVRAAASVRARFAPEVIGPQLEQWLRA